MPAECAITAPTHAGPAAPSARSEPPATRAALLCARARARTRRHLIVVGRRWLLLAAGCWRPLGPLFGKRFIDNYLLPRNADIPAIALLLAGCLVAGMARDAAPLLPARAPGRPGDALGAAACARASTATCCGCR